MSHLACYSGSDRTWQHSGVVAFFRDPIVVRYVDEQNAVLLTSSDTRLLPRAGDSVLLAGRPYRVVRVGFDLPEDDIEVVWIVCLPT